MFRNIRFKTTIRKIKTATLFTLFKTLFESLKTLRSCCWETLLGIFVSFVNILFLCFEGLQPDVYPKINWNQTNDCLKLEIKVDQIGNWVVSVSFGVNREWNLTFRASTSGVINTSIVIYQSISKVLLVDHMTIRLDPVCLFPQLGCYVFSSSVSALRWHCHELTLYK